MANVYDQRLKFAEIIFAIVIFYWLGQGLLYCYGIKEPSKSESFVASALVFAAILGIGFIFDSVAKIRERSKRCPHGISGGISRGLCPACADEKKATEEEYRKQREIGEQQQKIRISANELRNTELMRLTKTILPNLDELRELTPQKFEDEIAAMFKRLGYDVKQTPYSSDAGRDAILWKGGEKYLLECKRYSADNQSGRPELQKFHSAIITDGAKKGFFVSTGRFAATAAKFAKTAQIELINGNRLVKYLLDSKSEISDDDSYYSKCLQCGELVQHHLRTPKTVPCRNNHPVEPTLILDKILGVGPDTVHTCQKCSAPMRLINGRNGKFWGCTRYPACRSTKPWKALGG